MQNAVKKLFSGIFLTDQNGVYLRINSLKFYTVYFYCMTSLGLLKYTKDKLQTTCFYLIKSFFKKQKEVLNYNPRHNILTLFNNLA